MVWQVLVLGQVLFLGFFTYYKKRLSKWNSYAVLFAINALPAPFLFLLAPSPPSLGWFWAYPLLSIIFYGVGGVLDIKALREGDVSLISPLYTFRNVFVLALSALLLGEALTVQKLSGVLLVFLGAGFLNKKTSLVESLKALFKKRVVILTFLSTLFFSLANVVDKFSLTFFNEWFYAFIIYAGYAAFMAPPMIASEGLKGLKEMFKKDWWSVVLAGFCVSGSYALFLASALLVDVSIIVPLTTLSVFISVLLGWKFLGERVEKRWVAATIMVLGAVLLVS